MTELRRASTFLVASQDRDGTEEQVVSIGIGGIEAWRSSLKPMTIPAMVWRTGSAHEEGSARGRGKLTSTTPSSTTKTALMGRTAI